MLLGPHLRDHEHVWGRQKTRLYRNPTVGAGGGQAQDNDDKEERERVADGISSSREAKRALTGQGDR